MTWTTHFPLIAILRGIRLDEVLVHTQMLVDAGLDAIEIPLNSPDWAQSVQLAACALGDRTLTGAGIVLHPEDVDPMAMAGGKPVVMPNTYAPAIHVAAQTGLVTCTGCTTATEAFAAFDAGTQALKASSVGVLGPGYARALKAVLPAEVSVSAVDGIMSENLADYLVVGRIGAGLGSDLYRPGRPVECTAERARASVTTYCSAQPDHT